ncbi:MAG: class I SAM-dependent methyltransferase [bacterium]
MNSHAGNEAIDRSIREYYENKLKTHGANHKGMDWSTKESQVVRFEQLTKVITPANLFSIIDYGCGYGSLLDYLIKKRNKFQYCGYDISKEMILTARRKYGDNSKRRIFISDETKLLPADYVIASGIFNVKLDYSSRKWELRALKTINKMNKLSRRGFSFNMLTKYSDFTRKDLYYGDPLLYFDYCKKNISKNVALLHDYKLYDFTIIVRK